MERLGGDARRESKHRSVHNHEDRIMITGKSQQVFHHVHEEINIATLNYKNTYPGECRSRKTQVQITSFQHIPKA